MNNLNINNLELMLNRIILTQDSILDATTNNQKIDNLETQIKILLTCVNDLQKEVTEIKQLIKSEIEIKPKVEAKPEIELESK